MDTSTLIEDFLDDDDDDKALVRMVIHFTKRHRRRRRSLAAAAAAAASLPSTRRPRSHKERLCWSKFVEDLGYANEFERTYHMKYTTFTTLLRILRAHITIDRVRAIKDSYSQTLWRIVRAHETSQGRLVVA